MTTTMRKVMKPGSTALGMLLVAQAATAQFTQQGSKLAGTGQLALWPAQLAWSVSLSADGNTAIAGGPIDNSFAGAAWVWTRSGGVWTQQGSKLVGTGALLNATQGYSVALSGDGNTAIVGGPGDSFGGAVWVWTRSGGVWTQQGTKLVGSGFVGNPNQGRSVSLSADGNTAIVGGPGDNGNGAAWVLTRSGGVWTQQGTKLVGSGNVGNAGQGESVSLSADGNTAIVGGYQDNGAIGAAWIWTRSGGVWTQQGTKLVGSGSVGNASQGRRVSLSSDGNTAIVGGDQDNGANGAAWVWTRSGGVWTQQGTKLVGSGNVANAQQGYSVSLSGDGNIAVVGGYQDNGAIGAAWVWTRSGGVWAQQETKLVGSGFVGNSNQGTSVSLSADSSTALIGGATDNGNTGSAWVFTYSAPASATQLAFVQQPTATVAGLPITPAVTVQLRDVGGNPVAQAGVTIMISLSSGTGALGGTLSQVTDASGLATFSNLWINLVGSKQLTAASAGLTSALSSAFTITAAAAVNIVATGGTSQSAPIGTQFGQPLQVMVTDSFGNPVVGALVTYSAPGSGPSATLSSGGSATTNASGLASVTATANGVVGGPYVVSGTTGILEPGTFGLTNLPAGVAVQIPALDQIGLALLAALLSAVAFNVLNRQ
jgi:hypothetical protein